MAEVKKQTLEEMQAQIAELQANLLLVSSSPVPPKNNRLGKLPR